MTTRPRYPLPTIELRPGDPYPVVTHCATHARAYSRPSPASLRRVRRLLDTLTETCPLCHQPIRDERHAHPHDYSGTASAMLAGIPCLSCNHPHKEPTQ